MKKIWNYILICVFLLNAILFSGCGIAAYQNTTTTQVAVEKIEDTAIDEPSLDGSELDAQAWYYSPEEVALYIHTFETLPLNYMTKAEAEEIGWVSSEGNLWDVADGMCIGGDRFGNREGLLPEGKYKECDVNYSGGFRGAERLVFTDEGDIYYTSDHYESFTLLYGGE